MAGIGINSTEGLKGLPYNYPTTVQKYTSCRWRLGHMMMLAFALVMVLRNCISFAIVCMTGETNRRIADSQNQTLQESNSTQSTDIPGFETIYTGEFEYSSETQGLLISSSNYASFISPMVGAFCSHKFGPKKVILFFMSVSGILTLVSPLAARTHVYLLLVTRVVIGFATNTILPVSFDFWLHWAPEDEKAQLVAYSFSGFNFASVIQFALSGFLCLIPIDNGWPFVFYIFGACAILWCVVWLSVIHETPETHPQINEAEKTYILKTRTGTIQEKKTIIIPWKRMLFSKGVWAYFLVLFFHAYSSAILFSFLPLYMATGLNFDISQNGLLSSLPYVTRCLSPLVWVALSSKLTRVMSVTHTRKLIQSGGFFVAAALTFVLCYLSEGQEYIAVAIFIISAPFQAVTNNAGMVTPVDMSPQHASVITSVGMTLYLAGSMISPMIVSSIITERTREQWSIVFYSKCGIYVFAALVFLIFGTGELQPWAENSQKETEDSKSHKYEENVGYVADQDENTHM